MKQDNLSQRIKQLSSLFMLEIMIIYKHANKALHFDGKVSGYLENEILEVLMQNFVPSECLQDHIDEKIDETKGNNNQDSYRCKSKKKNRWQRLKKADYLKIQKKVRQWIENQLNEGILPTGKNIRKYALSVCKNSEFKASPVWFLNFLHKNQDLEKKMVQLQQIKQGGQCKPVYGEVRFSDISKKYDEKVILWIEGQLEKGKIPCLYEIARKLVQEQYGKESQDVIKRKARIKTTLRFLRRHPELRERINKQKQKLQIGYKRNKLIISIHQFKQYFKQILPDTPDIEFQRLIFRLDPGNTGKINHQQATILLQELKFQENQNLLTAKFQENQNLPTAKFQENQNLLTSKFQENQNFKQEIKLKEEESQSLN